MIKQKFCRIAKLFGKARPNKALVILFGLWVSLVLFYRLFFQIRPYDTPDWFPISELYLTGFHTSGVWYLVLFWVILLIAIWKIPKIKEILVVCAGWGLIVTGNLMQGGFVTAFLRSFYAEINQYYSDAIMVDNWRTWLAGFNDNLPYLTGHTQTHPPFAVLIHNIFLSNPSHPLETLGIGFAVLSMCTIPLLMIILRLLQIDPLKRKFLILLFSVIPAINIYSINCLDGVILTTSTIFLLGIVVLLKKPERKTLGILLLTIGFLTTSLLNYAVLFLLGVGGLVSIYEIIKYKKITILTGLLVCVFSFLGVFLILKYGFHYDYAQSFMSATKLENILRISFIFDIRNYGLTRFEDVSEMAFFLSFPVLAYLTTDAIINKNLKNFFKNDMVVVAFTAILTILFVFIIGTYKTGETARSCLFVYPYLVLFLLNKEKDDYLWMILLVAIQTSIMQIYFGFYW